MTILFLAENIEALDLASSRSKGIVMRSFSQCSEEQASNVSSLKPKRERILLLLFNKFSIHGAKAVSFIPDKPFQGM